MTESSAGKLSLCMIVRDEAEMLPGCLESAAGVVDEMIVVDTGSSDATPEIVKAHGGRLLRHAWQEDFSAARNLSLDAATGDWVLWMDADERLRPEEHERIRRLIGREASADAFLIPVRSDTPTGAQVTRAHRLFRNRKGIRFSGCIHEQVSPSFARIGARVGSSADFTIDHLGYNLSAEKLQSKHERNLKLLTAAKRRDPRDAYVRFCLGQCHLLLGDAATAENEIRTALGETPSGKTISKRLPDDIRAAAFNNLAQCALGRGAPEEALRRCAESLRICRDQVTAHLMAYRAHQALGQEEQALQELAATDRLLATPAGGRSAIEVTVDRGELWRAMGHLQLQLGRPREAKPNFERALDAGPQRAATLAALARCAIAGNALDEALRLALEASALRPADDGLADLTCFILLKLGRFGDAADRMRALIERRPGDQVLRRHLIGVLIKAGRSPEAALAAAKLQPDNPVGCSK